MARRTKIIATIGPASDSEATLKDMIAAGMDVARIGLAHDGLDTALERYHRIRAASAALDREVGILVDLPGPKVRAGHFPDAGVMLAEGSVLTMVPGTDNSTAEVVQVDYLELLNDIHHGDTLGFGDGAVVVEVIGNTGDALEVRVIHGGEVTGRPGVHIPSDRLRIPTPTPNDLVMLDAFIDVGVDMVAVSFVRSAHDVRRVGVEPHPWGPIVVAKIETRAAVDNLEGIVEASGAIMVARGDLGMEFPIEELPHLQKQIIQKCISLGRPTITATQMLESMVHAPTPTRAEASDVANAVFDGSSALMLSGETAMGADPVNAVATMSRIAARADMLFDYRGWGRGLSETHMTSITDSDDAITDAMSMAGWRAALETNAQAIICLTSTGFTVRSIARFRPEARILAFSPDERTVRQLSMSWGARAFPIEALPIDQMINRALELARTRGEVRSGDLVAVLAGSPEYQGKATDTLRLMPRSVTEAAAGAAGIVDDVVDGLAVYRHHPSEPSPSVPTLPVVMLHGSMDRAASFLKVTRRLPELDIVRYDRRGYGRSVGAGLSPTVDAQVDDLFAVMGHRPAVVIGHSLGGVIALRAAVRRPDLVPSVAAFESPMSWLEWWPKVSAGNRAMAASRDEGPEEAAERFMRGMVGDEIWEKLPARTRRERRSEGPALLAELAAIRGEPPYEPGELTVPVLAGYGTESKPYHQEAARKLAELAPDGELMVVEGSGHACQSSHPADFAAFVRRAVERAGRPTERRT